MKEKRKKSKQANFKTKILPSWNLYSRWGDLDQNEIYSKLYCIIYNTWDETYCGEKYSWVRGYGFIKGGGVILSRVIIRRWFVSKEKWSWESWRNKGEEQFGERKRPVQSLRLKPDLAYLTNSREARVDAAECAKGCGRSRAQTRRLQTDHVEGHCLLKNCGFFSKWNETSLEGSMQRSEWHDLVWVLKGQFWLQYCSKVGGTPLREAYCSISGLRRDDLEKVRDVVLVRTGWYGHTCTLKAEGRIPWWHRQGMWEKSAESTVLARFLADVVGRTSCH